MKFFYSKNVILNMLLLVFFTSCEGLKNKEEEQLKPNDVICGPFFVSDNNCSELLGIPKGKNLGIHEAELKYKISSFEDVLGSFCGFERQKFISYQSIKEKFVEQPNAVKQFLLSNNGPVDSVYSVAQAKEKIDEYCVSVGGIVIPSNLILKNIETEMSYDQCYFPDESVISTNMLYEGARSSLQLANYLTDLYDLPRIEKGN